jgi:hypothetical protein
MKIVRAEQTSLACPSQWDAWTENGQYLYLRYRHGHGTVTAYSSSNWLDTWESGEPVAEFYYGDALDGYIELDKFCELAGIELL